MSKKNLPPKLAVRKQSASKTKKKRALPICACCKKIRVGVDHWEQLEGYLLAHFGIEFTHTLCPSDLAADMAAADKTMARIAEDMGAATDRMMETLH